CNRLHWAKSLAESCACCQPNEAIVHTSDRSAPPVLKCIRLDARLSHATPSTLDARHTVVRERRFTPTVKLVPLDAPEGPHEVEGPFEFQECGRLAARDPRLHVG